MTPGELAAVRGRLEEFAAEMFAPLARRDQRDKGATVRARIAAGRAAQVDAADGRAARGGSSGAAAGPLLLHLGGGAGARAAGPPTGAGEPVRERLAHRAVEVIAPEAWVVDDTGFVKDGTASPGVARQYSGTL